MYSKAHAAKHTKPKRGEKYLNDDLTIIKKYYFLVWEEFP